MRRRSKTKKHMLDNFRFDVYTKYINAIHSSGEIELKGVMNQGL